MRRSTQDTERADATLIAASRPTAQRSVEAQLLALQRSAGNRAVSAELARDAARVVPFVPAASVQRACCSGCADGGTCESETDSAAPASQEAEAQSADQAT